MSQSHKPTSAPERRSAAARLAATVDLPTPPFPLAIAITYSTPEIFVVPVCPLEATSGGFVMSITTLVDVTPGIAANTCSDSRLECLRHSRVIGRHTQTHQQIRSRDFDLFHQTKTDDVPAVTRKLNGLQALENEFFGEMRHNIFR